VGCGVGSEDGNDVGVLVGTFVVGDKDGSGDGLGVGCGSSSS